VPTGDPLTVFHCGDFSSRITPYLENVWGSHTSTSVPTGDPLTVCHCGDFSSRTTPYLENVWGSHTSNFCSHRRPTHSLPLWGLLFTDNAVPRECVGFPH